MTVLTPEQLQQIRECCKDEAAFDTVITLFNQSRLLSEDEDRITANPFFAQRILRVSPSLVYVYDLIERRYIYSNYNLTSVLGYTWEQIREFGDLLTIMLAHPDDLECILEYYMKAALAKDDEVLTLEYRLKHADGHWVWLYSQEIVFRREPDGTARQILGVARDTSDLKETVEALRHSEARLRAVMDSQIDSIARYDLELRLTFANEAYCRFLGKPLEALMGESLLQYIPKAEHEDLLQKIASMVLTGKTHVEERQLPDTDGSLCWILWTVQPIVTNWGDVIEIQLTGRDITDRKQAEMELHHSRANYELLIRNLPDTAVMLFDRNLHYMEIEGDVLSKFGYEKSSLHGKTLSDVLPPEAIAKLELDYRAVLRGQTVIFEYQHGKNILEVSIVPVNEKTGEIMGGMLLFRDVTEQRKAVQQQLELSLEKERVRLLAEFIQNVSHEFRTPLSVINSSAHLLTKQPDPDKRQAHFVKIAAQVENLTQLVDNLLEMTRIDYNNQEQRDTVDLNGVARLVVARHQAEIQQKRLHVTFELDQSLPHVTGSTSAIESSINHIMENAIRYTPADGQIVIRSHTEDQFAALTITDTGIGMDADTMLHIFDTFYRADEAHSTRGFGLGLTIARRIIEAHKGRIYVNSQPNQGSTFSIFLPILQ